MGFVDRLITRKRKAETDDRSEYGRLVALEASGTLSEADDAKLEGLMLRLGVSQADFQSHVDAARKVAGYMATIERLKDHEANRAKTMRESEKFDAKWKPILEEFNQGRDALQARHLQHAKDDGDKFTAEREINFLRIDNPLAFGIPVPDPVPKPTDIELRERQRNTEMLVEAAKVVGHLRDQTPNQHGPISKFQLECLEYAEAQGKIEKGWASKARKFVPKEPEPKLDIVEFPERRDSAPRHPVFGN